MVDGLRRRGRNGRLASARRDRRLKVRRPIVRSADRSAETGPTSVRPSIAHPGTPDPSGMSRVKGAVDRLDDVADFRLALARQIRVAGDAFALARNRHMAYSERATRGFWQKA